MNSSPRLSSNAIQSLLVDFEGFKPHVAEKTIFSVGGRGHFENPISDVLAFFLNPNENHELGDFVLTALLKSANSPIDSCTFQSIRREETTDTGKRIDILIEGDNWVIAIENKIFHGANNPFEEYEAYLKTHFEQKSRSFFLLTPKNDKANRWTSIDYQEFINKIRSSWGQVALNSPFNKWHFFLRDFLVNIETIYGKKSMDDSQFLFLEKNMNAIYKLDPVKEDFKNEIQSRTIRALNEALPDHNFSAREEPFGWYHCPAFRYHHSGWKENSKVVMVTGFGLDDTYLLTAYADQMDESSLEKMKPYFVDLHPIRAWTEKHHLGACRLDRRIKDLNEAIPNLVKLAIRLNEFEENRGRLSP